MMRGPHEYMVIKINSTVTLDSRFVALIDSLRARIRALTFSSNHSLGEEEYHGAEHNAIFNFEAGQDLIVMRVHFPGSSALWKRVFSLLSLL